MMQWLASDNGLVVHVSIFVMLLLGGCGFPIPEDVPILLGGVAWAKQIVSLHTVFLICYVGVMLGDQIMFLVGYHFGQRLLSAGTRSPFFPSITEEKVNEVREGLRKRRLLYIFIGRHLFPIRSVTFISAGALRIPFWEFFIADAIAALVSVGLMLWLGHVLGKSLSPETISHLAQQAHYYVAAIVVLIFVFYALRWRMRSRTKTPSGPSATVHPFPSKKEQDTEKTLP